MELYHVLNRGVDKRNIVMDDSDKKRFVADLLFMNSSSPVENLNFYFASSMDVGRPYTLDPPSEEEKLIILHGWCLMGNHYHLLLSERVEHGLSLFLKKLNGGYAKYFNEKYDRTGALFQGRTKRKLITTDAYFLYILHYIHFNPLDYLKGAQTWREKRIANATKALAWLQEYRWSSFQDYSGHENFPALLQGSFLFEERKEVIEESRRYLSTLQEDPEFLPLYSLE